MTGVFLDMATPRGDEAVTGTTWPLWFPGSASLMRFLHGTPRIESTRVFRYQTRSMSGNVGKNEWQNESCRYTRK